MESNSRPDFKLSLDTQTLIDYLLKASLGDFVSYSDLGRLIGRDVQKDAHSNLDTARRVLERDHQMYTATVRGEGIRMINASERVTELRTTHQKRIRSAAGKTLARLGRIQYEQLPPDKKREFNMAASFAGVVRHMCKEPQQKQLEQKVQQSSGRLSIGDTLEQFKK